MNSKELGTLESVKISEAWANELAFSAWLAKEENIDSLGKEIGLDLGEAKCETSVGPFFADVYCKDMENDRWVVIENQFHRTDHDHLGKLLTYAAGLDALTVVWIAEEFREEHRQAVDWLNEISRSDFHFFGVEIKIRKIGNSAPAPEFRVVSEPNDWAKAVLSMSTMSPLEKFNVGYWRAFWDFCKSQPEPITLPRKTPTADWIYFPLGGGGHRGNACFGVGRRRIWVSLLLKGDHADAHFRLLQEQQAQIEKEIGETLTWKEFPNKKSRQIMLIMDECDPKNEKDWQRQHKWLYEKMKIYHKVFFHRVRKIVAADKNGDGDDG